MATQLQSAFRPRGLDTHLRSIGYRFLGQGNDKAAYTTPEGTVYLIEVLQSGQTYQTSALNAFGKYCQTHQSNPRLMNFFGLTATPSMIGGVQYRTVQANVERLKPLTTAAMDAFEVSPLFSTLTSDEVMRLSRNADKFKAAVGPRLLSALPEDFLEAVYQVVKDTPAGFTPDLHADNIMMRGQSLVISDPWSPA